MEKEIDDFVDRLQHRVDHAYTFQSLGDKYEYEAIRADGNPGYDAELDMRIMNFLKGLLQT